MRVAGYAVGAVLILIGARGLLTSGEPLLGWALALLGIATALWRRGLRRHTAVGG